MLWIMILFLALFCAGYYFYKRLVTIEREIRATQQRKVDEPELPKVSEAPAVETPEVETPEVEQDAQLNAAENLLEDLLATVRETPGLAQLELYRHFADRDRRELQKMLRELDHQGRLRREKKGSSYRLFPL